MAREIKKVQVCLRGDDTAASACTIEYAVEDGDMQERQNLLVDEAPATNVTLQALCQAAHASAETEEGIP